ncbi:tetratricopeptide repeat protein [Symmachiella dynata]|uniref:tetratricopeptide repeat protein n=1 Tax=Symmachiella dynata TaxID=2527995 RepID=UPI0030ED7270
MTQTSEFQVLCKEARQCWRDGEYQCAVELFEQALEIEEVSETHQHAGMAAYMAGDTENAVKHLIRATHLAPSNSQARINLGAVYNRRKEYKLAIDALRKGLAMDMHCAEGYFNLGMAHRHQNEPKMAIPALREAIRLDPKMADAHVQLAEVYSGQGNYKQAIELAEQALKIKPGFEAAQQILDEAEQGRDTAKASSKNLDWIAGVSPTKLDQGFRELTDEQQVADHRHLVVLAHSIHQIANDVLLQMRRELDPATRQVYRIVSRPEKNPGTLTEAYAAFKRATKSYKILRDRLGVKMQELRDYEESMKENNGE